MKTLECGLCHILYTDWVVLVCTGVSFQICYLQTVIYNCKSCADSSEDSFSMSTSSKAAPKGALSEVRTSSRGAATLGRGAAAVSFEYFVNYFNGRHSACVL